MPQAPRLDAILPAGGRIKGEFARLAGAEVKALIRIGERTVIERDIAALRALGCVDRVVVIGPPEVAAALPEGLVDAFLPEGQSGHENIYRGIDWLRENGGGRLPERVLVMTTDLPYLTADGLRTLLDHAPPDADIAIPAIERADFMERFPGTPREFTRLHDGQWLIGGAALVNPETLVRVRPLIERTFEARKSPFAMASILGFGLLWRYLFRRLTVPQIINRVQRILDCRAVGVGDCAPELGFDIDLQEEYAYAMTYPPGELAPSVGSSRGEPVS